MNVNWHDTKSNWTFIFYYHNRTRRTMAIKHYLIPVNEWFVVKYCYVNVEKGRMLIWTITLWKCEGEKANKQQTTTEKCSIGILFEPLFLWNKCVIQWLSCIRYLSFLTIVFALNLYFSCCEISNAILVCPKYQWLDIFFLFNTRTNLNR